MNIQPATLKYFNFFFLLLILKPNRNQADNVVAINFLIFNVHKNVNI